jgi:hypothetical protein
MGRWGISDIPTWNTIEAALAPATRRTYSTVFNSFLRYVGQANRTMENVRMIDVVSFLQEFVHEKKTRSTIQVANAALLHYFLLYNREDLLKHPIVKLHVKGAPNLAPIPIQKWVIWDPEVPLRFLLSQPIPTQFRSAGQEASLLLLLATGIRVSDTWRLGKKFSIVEDVCAFPYLEKRKTGVSHRNWSVDMKILVCVPFGQLNFIYVWHAHAAKWKRRNFCLFREKVCVRRLTRCESG